MSDKGDFLRVVHDNPETLENYENAVEREYDLEFASAEGFGLEEVEHPSGVHHGPPHAVMHHTHQPAAAPLQVESRQRPQVDAERVPSESNGFDIESHSEPPSKKTNNFLAYVKKMKGGLDTRLPVPPLSELWWSWIGSFLAILAVTGITQLTIDETNIPFVVGSFGASAVLLFGLTESKLSQPRSFLGGQVVSAIIGIVVRLIIPLPWIAGPCAMSLALLAMQLTCTTHPPGGATALIVGYMSELPKWAGFSYLVTIIVGASIMQVIALLINNLSPHRVYPTFWW